MKIIYCYIALFFLMSFDSLADNYSEWTKTNADDEVRALTDKSTLKQGDDMPLWLEIKNKSSKSYYLVDIGDVLGAINFFSVMDQHEQKAPYSSQIKWALNPYSAMFEIGRSDRPRRIDIPPGEVKKIKVIDNLLELVHFQKTGKYNFNSTIFLYHKEKNKFNVSVLKVPPLSFNIFDVDNSKKVRDENRSEKFIDIKFWRCF